MSRIDRAQTVVSSPSRSAHDMADVDYPKLVRELRAKLQLAGEMGKALLETNARFVFALFVWFSFVMVE
jgi:hypothetical protein